MDTTTSECESGPSPVARGGGGEQPCPFLGSVNVLVHLNCLCNYYDND